MSALLFSAVLLFLASDADAAADADGSNLSDVTTIDCTIAIDGTTTCAVANGKITVCSRRDGEKIRRSYRLLDYLPDPEGCTLDGAYWRTHSSIGDEIYDDTWDRLGEAGIKSSFFETAYTYQDILENSGDSPFDRLASIFVVAELNRLNGTKLPAEVRTAYDTAANWMLDYNNRPAGATEENIQKISVVLEDYVSGRTGTGLCMAQISVFGTGDVGKILVGSVSEDRGRIVKVEKGEGRGEGVAEVLPETEGDHFIVADEPFKVNDIQKAKFTREVNDCVDLDTGEQTTVQAGGYPNLPITTTTNMITLARELLIMIALADVTGQEVLLEPAAGPGSSGDTNVPSNNPTGSPNTPATGGITPFPSSVLPATTEASGGGSDLIRVPNVIGMTESNARSTILAADLVVGSVSVISSLDPQQDFRIIAVAHAQENEATVNSTIPDPDTLVPRFSTVDLLLIRSPIDMPEPGSLAIFLMALLILVYFAWRKRAVG